MISVITLYIYSASLIKISRIVYEKIPNIWNTDSRFGPDLEQIWKIEILVILIQIHDVSDHIGHIFWKFHHNNSNSLWENPKYRVFQWNGTHFKLNLLLMYWLLVYKISISVFYKVEDFISYHIYWKLTNVSSKK